MAIRSRKPTSAGRRFQTSSDFSEVTKSTPEKSLLAKKSKTGGRNVYGRKTSRHIGGGHKQRYRVVDFKRTKDGVTAKVAAIEYDPNRTCRIALLHYADGEKAYILAPKGLSVGTTLHNVELRPGQGGKVGRSAGMDITIVTTATDNAGGKALLDAFGFPFKKGVEAEAPADNRQRGRHRRGPVKSGAKK